MNDPILYEITLRNPETLETFSTRYYGAVAVEAEGHARIDASEDSGYTVEPEDFQVVKTLKVK